MMNRSNAFYKIVSVIIAITLWTYVIVTSEPMKTEAINDVHVNLINVANLTAKGLALSGDANFTVSVKVKGRRAEIVKLEAEQILANADLFGFAAGENYIPVTVTVPETLQIVDVTPAKIIVNIEELVAVSKPVVVKFAGAFKDGTEAGSVTTQPEAIEVSGPKSLVEQVAYIRAEVNASKVKSGGGDISVNAEPVNADSELIAGVTLSSNVIDITASLLKKKEVELVVPIEGTVGNAYEVTKTAYPKKITIRGSDKLIDEIDKIEAEPINISDVTTNTNFPIKPILPAGVEVAEVSQGISMVISLKGITSKVFEYGASEILAEEVPENSTLAIDTAKIQVKITGIEAKVGLMNKSDFVPYINLKDATKDLTITEVFVRSQQEVTTLQVVPSQINITLSEVE